MQLVLSRLILGVSDCSGMLYSKCNMSRIMATHCTMVQQQQNSIHTLFA